MSARTRMAGKATVLGLVLVAVTAGCAPQVMERSQRLQLAAMVQYRDEMAAYHEKLKAQLDADKQRELDVALEASLRQAADGEGRVAVAAAMEKVRKRKTIEEGFRANLARLDHQFAERQEAIGRAIDLARQTLGLIEDYSRLGVLVRSLFVKEVEAQQLIGHYENEGSANHGGSGSKPEAGGS